MVGLTTMITCPRAITNSSAGFGKLKDWVQRDERYLLLLLALVAFLEDQKILWSPMLTRWSIVLPTESFLFFVMGDMHEIHVLPQLSQLPPVYHAAATPPIQFLMFQLIKIQRM